MTSFFHDLEDQLRTAARERTGAAGAPGDGPGRPPRHKPRRGPRGWLAGSARALPVAVAVAVTLIVLVGALVLLGHRGGQSASAPASGGAANAFAALIARTPPSRLSHEYALLGAVSSKVRLGACRQTLASRVAQANRVSEIHGVPARALLSTLGVLRRPATAADRLPESSLPMHGQGLSVYAGATRRAARIGQTSYYFVPVREDLAASLPSARCLAMENAAMTRALPTFPAALRGDMRVLIAAFIAYERDLAAKPSVDAICQVAQQRNGGGMSCSDTADQIRHGLFPEADNGTFTGLVPDGVASVTLSFPAAAGGSARSVSAKVHGNVYAVHVGASQTIRPGSPTIRWRAADGRVLKTYAEQAVTSVRQLCRQHPAACLPAVLLMGGVSTSSGSGSSESSRSSSATTAAPPSSRPKTSGS